MQVDANTHERSQDPSALGERIERDRVDLRQELLRNITDLGAAEARLLGTIRGCDVAELWRLDGARNIAEWVSAWTGFSQWKARRAIAAAHALPSLPAISSALEEGALCLDKVVELTRFADPTDEEDLVRWARRVTARRVRERADEEVGRKVEQARDAFESRNVEMWTAEDRWFMEAQLPLEQGAAVEQAIRKLAREVPAAPQGENESKAEHKARTMPQREADAFVRLLTGSSVPDVTLVLQAPAEKIADDDAAVAFAGGVLHSETIRRLSCDARLQVTLTDRRGKPLGIGRESREIPDWLRRAILHRDKHRCTFPGCETRADLIGHHIQHWGREGPTDLDNLLSVCKLHHFYIHEGGWSVVLNGDVPTWFRPSGRVYDPGPPIPERAAPSEPKVATWAEAAGYSRMFDLVAGGTELPTELDPTTLRDLRRRRSREAQLLMAALVP
jgi:hypothetical protein